ncbi:hydrogenase maturation protein [Magnetospira sp. QH-2]|uniref:hydrogenase maturation protein n=1 Tax=Magnetospira sp. (strain QH-2) TaxID=1288970 RepID=UPI0003E8114A|nr:hydrogenase maturation protein [Magnetospira sp. QH-2]CCQ75219.1 Hydrogenase maturation factor hoxX [Magnetospira sp. QH-2]
MRILLLTHAFNSLAQRLFVDLRQWGHEVAVEFDVNDAVTREAVDLFQPDLLVAPFLKRAIPEDVYARLPCWIIHPGPVGDRGPSSLDWAIQEGVAVWGVTILEAAADFDAGDIRAGLAFPLRAAAKSSLYRNEVTEAAVEALQEALESMDGPGTPQTRHVTRPAMTQADRAIDWSQDTTETVLRKIRAADGFPGVRDRSLGRDLSLFDAHRESELKGSPGALIAHSGPAVCRATVDGAVWIGRLRDWETEEAIKLPATMVLADQIGTLPMIEGHNREIWIERQNGVVALHFPFHNGAMDTRQCRSLKEAFDEACAGPENVVVLMGGPDFWSNGIHLNLIEITERPADESWANINAMDDLAEAVIRRTDKLVVAALRGNAGAGGVFLALAADRVWARRGVILNPHYKGMGNLYGSEFWTYLLPRRTNADQAAAIAEARLPMGTTEALGLGLLDEILDDFEVTLMAKAEALAESPDLERLLADKAARRAADEAEKPLAQFRAEELERMKLNFYGFDPSYHVARYNFVNRVPKSRTPLTIAPHRRARGSSAPIG